MPQNKSCERCRDYPDDPYGLILLLKKKNKRLQKELVEYKIKSLDELKKLAKTYKTLIAPNPKGHDVEAIENAGFDILDWVKENL
jgi:hypothetical protein